MDIDLSVLKSLEAEKDISLDLAIKAIEDALLVAYHKTDGAAAVARVEVNRGTGHVTVWAREAGADGEPGREYDDTPAGFGRIAATTARQVILQRLRDAEDELTFGEYAGREGDVVAGVIQQGRDPRAVLVDLGKLEAILPPTEQVPGERYVHGERLRCYVLHVRKGYRGPSVTLSRTHPNLVKKLFAMEVPEIASGAVEIAAIAREAGHRSKIAVISHQPGVNAKGACIGPMGSRVRNVMTELHGEKIDIVDYSADPAEFVAHALSPARVPACTWWTCRRGWPRSSCRTTSCRWLSARKGRMPGLRPGSPAGGSTSGLTRARPAPRPPQQRLTLTSRPTLRRLLPGIVDHLVWRRVGARARARRRGRAGRTGQRCRHDGRWRWREGPVSWTAGRPRRSVPVSGAESGRPKPTWFAWWRQETR